MKNTYLKPQIEVIVSEVCMLNSFSKWHVDHDGEHTPDIEGSDNFGDVIIDNGKLDGYDPFDDNNW